MVRLPIEDLDLSVVLEVDLENLPESLRRASALWASPHGTVPGKHETPGMRVPGVSTNTRSAGTPSGCDTESA